MYGFGDTRKEEKRMSPNFRAFVVNQTVNYKDALVCIPDGRVARTYPLVPGLELAGAIAESTDPRFKTGDNVLAYDFGSTQGISRHGGYSEYARVPGDFLFRLPEGLGYKQALVLTAGMTAAMGLRQLEKNGLRHPQWARSWSPEPAEA